MYLTMFTRGFKAFSLYVNCIILVVLQVLLIGTPQFSYLEQKLEVKGKPAALLALIAAHYPTGLTRVQAERYLWGREAAQNLRQAIYTLRQLFRAKDWLVSDEKLSLTNPQFLTTDQPQELMQGMEGLLSDEGLEWLGLQREKMRLEQRRILWQAAQESQGQARIALLEQLLTFEPLHESAAQLLIGAYLDQNNQVAAREVFTQLKLVLKREFGAEPLPATKALLWQSEPKNQPDLQRYKRAYAVVGRLDTPLIAQMLEADELEVAEILSQLGDESALDIEQTPKPIWQLLHRRAAQLLGDKDLERAARHWLEADEPEQAASAWLDLAEQRFGTDLSQSLALCQKVLEQKVNITLQLKAYLLQHRVFEIQANWQAIQTLVKQLFALARTSQNDEVEFAAHQVRVSWLVRTGQPQAALESSEDAIRAAKRLNDPVKIEQMSLLQGTAYLQMGDFVEAKKWLGSLLGASAVQTRLSAYSNLGAIEGLSNNLETALDYFEQALRLARQTQNLAISARVVQNIATTAEKLERFERAKSGWREAIQIAEQISDSHSLGIAYANLALTHCKAGQVGLALNTASEALEIQPLSPVARFTALNTQAAVWRYVSNTEAALGLYQSALELARSQENTRWMADTQCNIAFMAWLADPKLEPDLLDCLKAPTTPNVIEEMKLEYGLNSHNPNQIRALLPKTLEQRPRQRLIQAIIAVRLAILEQQHIDLNLESILNGEQFLETRLGWLVLASWLEQQGLDSHFAKIKAKQVFAQQCQGLPHSVSALTLD